MFFLPYEEGLRAVSTICGLRKRPAAIGGEAIEDDFDRAAALRFREKASADIRAGARTAICEGIRAWTRRRTIAAGGTPDGRSEVPETLLPKASSAALTHGLGLASISDASHSRRLQVGVPAREPRTSGAQLSRIAA
jgi:hypothetical protein